MSLFICAQSCKNMIVQPETPLTPDATKVKLDIDEEDIIDSDTRSHQSQSTFDEHRVNEQLERAEADLEHLRSIPNEPADIIKEGALIETNNLLLYVGIITKTITEDGKEIIGISTDAPIFKTLVGQKKGFQFKLANSDCSILSIQ